MLMTRSNPTGLAVDLDVLKLALRIGADADDDRLTQLIRAETARYEAFTGRVLLPTGFRLSLAGWSFPACLPVLPVRTVSSVTYLDPDHAEQTLSASAWYAVEAAPLWSVDLDTQASLPALSDRPWPVRIDFDAGHDDPEASGAGDVPALAQRADDQDAIIHMVGVTYDQGAPLDFDAMRKVFGSRRVIG
ncbi:phage head-tail connector protein [Salipiger sp. H15]|uniref:Phage head-tail connector protein n=1 Tax=Alloyangia sp. H15 TaxID=3029062 RepID=A0AAU8AN58_9RHOB